MKKQNEKIKQKQETKKCSMKEKGITLIALVVTIIVLLILAGVSIAMLTGEGGILKQAGEARERTGRANIIEQARVDLLEKQTENKGKVSKEDLYEVLNKYFENVPDLEDETWNDEKTWKKEEVTGKNDKTVKVEIGQIYEGSLGEKGNVTTGTVDDDQIQDVEQSTSYIGYYADFEDEDGNKTPDGIPDGIIYADLAIGGEGQWNEEPDGKYKYDQVTEGLKSYKIGEKKKVAEFNNYEKEVVYPADGTSGTDRFYVMALKDIEDWVGCYWYYNASELDNIEKNTDVNFKVSDGKLKTSEMIRKYESEAYGEAYKNERGETDLWGLDSLKLNVEKGWFVPSRAEWSAFGDMLYSGLYLPEKVTESNYYDYGFQDCYWSSSQCEGDMVFGAGWYPDGIGCYSVQTYNYVRLSTTF